MCVHESIASLHASTVHDTPSSQGEPELAVHPVPIAPAAGLHDSVPLQYNPSSHAALFAVWIHAPFVHTSVVQEKPSSHSLFIMHMTIIPLELDEEDDDDAIPLEHDDEDDEAIPLELDVDDEEDDDEAIPLELDEPPIPPIPPELLVIPPPIPLDEGTMPPVPPIPLELEIMPPEPPEAPPVPIPPAPPLPPIPAVPDELFELEPASPPDPAPLVVVGVSVSSHPLTMANVIAAIQ